MPLRKIEFIPREFYHLYNRGCGRDLIYFDPGNYRHFLKLLREYSLKEGVEIGAFCLMPNHYHLLLRPNRETLASMLKNLGTSYVMSINKQLKRTGTLFEGRFQAKHVDREEYLTHLSRYIHRNPVEAGLVKRCGEWEFSSYREYVEEDPGGISRPEIVLRGGMEREEYRRFVEFEGGDVGIGHLAMD